MLLSEKFIKQYGGYQYTLAVHRYNDNIFNEYDIEYARLYTYPKEVSEEAENEIQTYFCIDNPTISAGFIYDTGIISENFKSPNLLLQHDNNIYIHVFSKGDYNEFTGKYDCFKFYDTIRL